MGSDTANLEVSGLSSGILGFTQTIAPFHVDYRAIKVDFYKGDERKIGDIRDYAETLYAPEQIITLKDGDTETFLKDLTTALVKSNSANEYIALIENKGKIVGYRTFQVSDQGSYYKVSYLDVYILREGRGKGHRDIVDQLILGAWLITKSHFPKPIIVTYCSVINLINQARYDLAGFRKVTKSTGGDDSDLPDDYLMHYHPLHGFDHLAGVSVNTGLANNYVYTHPANIFDGIGKGLGFH